MRRRGRLPKWMHQVKQLRLQGLGIGKIARELKISERRVHWALGYWEARDAKFPEPRRGRGRSHEWVKLSGSKYGKVVPIPYPLIREAGLDPYRTIHCKRSAIKGEKRIILDLKEEG